MSSSRTTDDIPNTTNFGHVIWITRNVKRQTFQLHGFVFSPWHYTFVSALFSCTWTLARCCRWSPWRSLLKVDLKEGGRKNCGLHLRHHPFCENWKQNTLSLVSFWKKKKSGSGWLNRYAHKTSGLHTQNDNKIVDPLATMRGFWNWNDFYLSLRFYKITSWAELTWKQQEQLQELLVCTRRAADWF